MAIGGTIHEKHCATVSLPRLPFRPHARWGIDPPESTDCRSGRFGGKHLSRQQGNCAGFSPAVVTTPTPQHLGSANNSSGQNLGTAQRARTRDGTVRTASMSRPNP